MKSLTNKMFLLTILTCMVIVIGFGFSIFAYFNWFYEDQKVNQIVSDLDAFTEVYKSQTLDDLELYERVNAFMKTHNATLYIFDASEALYLEAVPAISITASPAEVIISESEMESGLVMPTSALIGATTSINGMLVTFSNAESMGAIIGAVDVGSDYSISDVTLATYNQVNLNREVHLNDGTVKRVYVTASLQSVDEIIALMKELLPLISMAILILSFFLSLIYSQMISKPIVSITKHANAMANMNFNEPIPVKGRDELSLLATSLNTLSSELKSNISELNISNQKLQAEYDKEIKLEASRKAFVANVSHELRSPLGIIKSYAEGILDQIRIEKQEKYAQTIINEVNSMETLIQNMLEISKHDSGAVVLQPSEVSLSNLIHKALFVAQTEITDKKLNLNIDLTHDEIYVDELSIQRVIDNLVENAVKYAPPSSTIHIKSEPGEASHVNGSNHEEISSVKFSIENESTPFSEEELTRIWERFYKRDLSHHRREKGTGLGLSIVKSILEGHRLQFGAERTRTGISFYFIAPQSSNLPH